MAYCEKRELLILRRRQSLMPQIQVASRLNMSQAQYSNIENGYANPSKEIADKLITMFELDPNYFGEKQKEEKEQ